MQDFIRGKVAVVVHSQEELYELMALCEEAGIKWASGHAPMRFAPRCVWENDYILVYTVKEYGKECMMYGRSYGSLSGHRRYVDFTELVCDGEPAGNYTPMNMVGLFEA